MKLVKNELIKIFKRKSIYVLLLISIIIVIIYNYNNPDQNKSSINLGTKTINIQDIEEQLDSFKNNIELYITKKVTIEFYKIYNKYEENSWQRFALNEDSASYAFDELQYNHNIEKNLKLIYDYELNTSTEVTISIYEKAKEYLKKYIEALDSNDWKKFVELKIQNLEEIKNNFKLENTEISNINIEIEANKLRINNNIIFADNILNYYLEGYKMTCYQIENSPKYIDSQDKQLIEKRELLKYAINNNITQDISQENFNVIFENKIDARISLIRTFRHFDIILVITILYISCTIIVDEINKGTIKGLLTKPHKRSEIIISKILACLITIIVFMIFILITQFIVGGIIFGFDSYNLKYIGYNHYSNKIITMNLISYVTLVGLAKLPMYMIISLFATFLSIIINNISITFILTLIIFIVGNSALSEWSKLDSLATVTRFFITNNWDFSQYLFGQVSDVNGVTLPFSIIIYIIYSVIIFVSAIKIFNRKDVKNI